MRRLLFVALGWTLIVFGAVVMPMPIPIPMLGMAPILIGCAILTAYSKSFRRGLQRLRHRAEWLSKYFEHFKERGPMAIRSMVRRTHPHVLRRHARIRARREDIRRGA